ncbi:MAG: hypothetical protein R3F30_00455 [Planctomycetota bacterium]
MNPRQGKPDLRLHLLFAVLFIGSFFLDEQMRGLLGTWKDPSIGLLSYAIGIFWMASLLLDRLRAVEDRNRVLRDLVDRHEHKIRALEDELEAR